MQIKNVFTSVTFLSLLFFFAGAFGAGGAHGGGSSSHAVTTHTFSEIFYTNTFFPIQKTDSITFTSVKYVGKVVTYPIVVFRNFWVYWLG